MLSAALFINWISFIVMRMLYSILIAKIDILFGLAFNRRDKSVEEDTNVLYAGYFELSNKKTGTGLTTHACSILRAPSLMTTLYNFGSCPNFFV